MRRIYPCLRYLNSWLALPEGALSVVLLSKENDRQIVGPEHMPLPHGRHTTAFALAVVLLLLFVRVSCGAQAALLMEEPYGFFGLLNPTGHTAVYFQRVCAETPVKLRRCQPDELGAVISRYQGISGYDWVAIPLMPYLYSVEDGSEVPKQVDRDMVTRLRENYHETHLMSLGENLFAGSLVRGGWTQLIGVSYQRRIYAFRFDTKEEQDDAFIERMNSAKNRSHFRLLFSNCADFARVILNLYFPRGFRRSIFPDAGMTTPKQVANKLVRHARKHPEMHLAVLEIPQIPGYRRPSRHNKSISESLVTTVYAIPIVVINPYLAGGLVVDYLVKGRNRLIPKHPTILAPENLAALTFSAESEQHPTSASAHPASPEPNFFLASYTSSDSTGLEDIAAMHD